MTCILVVDDEKDTTELLAMTLSGEGYQIIETTSSVSAAQLARQRKPDLIILDLMMPDVSGLEVCKQIREDEETAHIPILILSALTEIEYKQKAFDAGADDYLAKPVQYSELNSRVYALLERHSAPQRAAETGDKVIAILGAGGGVGVSTAALNLAAAWSEKHPQTVLVELTPGTGGLASYLDLSPARSLADLLAHGEGILSQAEMRRQIRETVVQGPGGLNLLPSEQDPGLAVRYEISPTQPVEEIVRSLADSYDFVMLDLGHGYNARARVVCTLADHIFLIARAQVSSLQAAIRQIRLIEDGGVPAERIHTLLVAFYKAPYSLSPDQARQVFKEQDAPYNVLLGFPPMPDLIYNAQQRRQAVVTLEPQGAKLKDYLQGALERLLL